jgi:hypothetical protein
MSKFKVGDRVVVVGSHNSFRGQRGEVVSVDEEKAWPYEVKLPDDVWGSPVPYTAKELEFEHIYDALSAEPLDEASFVEVKIDSRPEDVVNHPNHYTSHPSGVECIQVTEHMNFNLGNAVKYVWRADLKSDSPIEDLHKARWYIEREIQRLGGAV